MKPKFRLSAILMWILALTFFGGNAFARQGKPDSVVKSGTTVKDVKKPEEKSTASDTKKTPAAPDQLINVTNSISLQDSAKINEVIVFKIKTSNIASYTTLYINGVQVAGLQPVQIRSLDSTVYFKLDLQAQKVAREFLPSKSVDKVILPVLLSIGTDKAIKLRSTKLFNLEVRQTIYPGWIWAMAVILILLLILAIRNNILKDDNNLYYSLGRTQLLFWTILLAMAYIYLCNGNETLPAIPSSILIILGISATTTAASKLIENDMNKIHVPVRKNAKSQGLLIDILSDANSINIQRFQNVVFNLLFGIVFIQKTISTNLMPEFDTNVLLMMGISAGTYAGLKSTEDKNKPVPSNNNPGGDHGPNGPDPKGKGD